MVVVSVNRKLVTHDVPVAEFTEKSAIGGVGKASHFPERLTTTELLLLASDATVNEELRSPTAEGLNIISNPQLAPPLICIPFVHVLFIIV